MGQQGCASLTWLPQPGAGGQSCWANAARQQQKCGQCSRACRPACLTKFSPLKCIRCRRKVCCLSSVMKKGSRPSSRKLKAGSSNVSALRRTSISHLRHHQLIAYLWSRGCMMQVRTEIWAWQVNVRVLGSLLFLRHCNSDHACFRRISYEMHQVPHKQTCHWASASQIFLQVGRI